MAAAARTQAHPDAAERIANRIAALAEPGTPVPPPQ
jgi:UDP-N-acetylglucosamine:LPS N-acetylglucosamine transferase